MQDPVKTLFSPSLITVQNLVVKCHTLQVYVGVQKIRSDGVHPLPMGAG